MKKIVISGNRPCFCNSGKKFKNCHGFLASHEILETYQIQMLLRDLYSKVLNFAKKEGLVDNFLEDFKQFSKIPEDESNGNKHEHSFIFIDFLVFRAKDSESHDIFFDNFLKFGNLSSYEKEFFSDLHKCKFNIYRVLSVNSETGFIELEDIFNKKVISFYDKGAISRIKKNGLLYGRIYNIFGRKGILPTFNYKNHELYNASELDNVVDSFFKRFDNLKNEFSEFSEFIDGIEYEIYGGENPYEVYELDERFERWQKEHPNKDFDDFLDEFENEILGV